MSKLKKARVTLMILLSMVLVITLMPQAAFAADEAQREKDRIKLERALDGDTKITFDFCKRYYLAKTLIYADIPDYVTTIESRAFDENTKVKEIIVPQSVKRIEDNAFGSDELEVVTFKGKVPVNPMGADEEGMWTIFGVYLKRSDLFRSNPVTIKCPDTEYEAYKKAFQRKIAEKLVNLVPIKVEKTVTEEEKELLKREEKRKEDRTAINKALPASKVDIANEQFASSELTYVEIPNHIQSIGEKAFYNNKNLKEVVIPASVIYIDSLAFHGCPQLESVTFSGEIPDLHWDRDEIFGSESAKGLTIYCSESEYKDFQRAFGIGRNKITISTSTMKSSGTRAAPTLKTYTVTEKPGTWRGNGTAATTIEAPSSELIGITLKDKAVTVDNYKVSGDTVITFNEDYLKTLEAGEHTFNVEFMYGAADVTVEKSNMLTYLLWGGIALVVIAGVVVVIVVRKRRRQNSADNKETA